MNQFRLFATVFLASLVLIGCQTTHPPTELKLENLLQQALADEFTPDREIIVSYVQIPPNMALDRHWHPGEEFHYYLEGEVEIVIDGQPSIIGTPGTVGHVPFQMMHTAIAKDKGARILVFRVHSKGQPTKYMEGSGTGNK